MLKLESLEVSGFKSFAEKARVVFPDRVTAIIGPNGCGKSNLSDAIAFVLGSATARNLRGEKMDDFIFGGTRKRKSSGLAEVRLTLRKTGDRPLLLNGVELDEEELEISRRVYRSGESQYLINRRRCRLMDIHQFLEDAGLGFSSYAMIAQGRIESFLTAKPLDRRALLEEAAQISGYKSKRRNAEMKLELAQQNLVRVNDIVVEVERQLRSLKRQAQKARLYRKLKEEFRKLLRHRFLIESETLAGELERLRGELAAVRHSEQKLAEQLAEKDLLHEQSNLQREAIETELGALQDRQAGIRLELDRSENSIRYHLEQIDQTRDSLEAVELERGSLGQSLNALNSEWQSCSLDSEALRVRGQETERELQGCEAVLLERSRKLGLKEEALEDLRGRLMRISSELATLRNLKEQNGLRSKKLEAERQKVSGDRADGIARLAETRVRFEAKQETLARLSDRVEESKRTFEEIRSLKDRLTSEFEELSLLETEIKNQLVALNERLQSLQELEISKSNYSEGVQKVLGHLSKSKVIQAGGTLADSIETSPQFERVVEEFLDEELEYILVDSLDEALRGLLEIRSLKSGKCTFLSVYSTNGFGKSKSAAAPSSLPGPQEGVYGTLAQVIQMRPEIQDAFFRILPQQAEAIVVSDMDRAMHMAHSYPESTFITLDGESLTPRGLVSGSAPNARKLGLLGLKRQRRELEKKVEAQQAALNDAQDRRQTRKAELAGVADGWESTRKDIFQLEKEVITVRHERDALADELERRTRTLRTLDFELERLEEESGELALKLEGSSESVSRLDQERERLELELSRSRDELQELRSSAARAQTELNSVAAGRKVLEERRAALARALQRLNSQREDVEVRLSSLGQRREQGDLRLKQLAEQVEHLKSRAEQLKLESINAERALDEVQGRFGRCKSQAREMEAELTRLRSEKSDAQEKRSGIEVECARVETQLQNLDAQCVENLRVPLMEALKGLSRDEIDAEETTRAFEQLRHRLEGFGPINMTALKEYQENEERYQFLSRQREDIERSIADTMTAIQEINRRSRARFSEAFEAVNRNFKSIFQRLFSGGDCGIELLDQDDMLECGIDVYAQPPGKRLQNVMLLSGGEKALTVFALLMGIFLYRPSRFCVLDEVDAPLDDANVRRFSGLIEEMSQETQFIIVTHNKRTMEIAQTLYGITMEEPGVSKVVSAQL